MSKCYHCNVTVLDDRETCPLCRGVLEMSGETKLSYPNISMKRRKLELTRRLISFFAITAIIISLYIDYHTKNSLDWSLITTGGIILFLAVFLVITNPASGYRKRLFVPFCGAVIYIFFIDFVTGYSGWSANYVFPGAMFLLNFVLIMLMIINRRSWQSYMIYQLAGVLVGAIPILLIYMGIVTKPLLSELSFGSSVLLFVGTLLIGGRAAHVELQRRFYI